MALEGLVRVATTSVFAGVERVAVAVVGMWIATVTVVAATST